MAASDLSTSQQEALSTYIAVTNQEPAEARSLLQRSQWNVQIAIAKFFDGEGPDPVEEARAAHAQAAADSTPSASGEPRRSGASRREVLLNGIPRSPRSSSSSPDRIPRIVPQSESQSLYQPPLPLALLLAPINLLTRLATGLFRLAASLTPAFLLRLPPFALLLRTFAATPAAGSPGRSPRRRPLSPRDTAARFVREFAEAYGTDHGLPFLEDGYAAAFDRSQRDLRFLLLLVLSPEHDDAAAFARHVLLAPEVREFFASQGDRLVLWAGSVQDSEAYQAARALRVTRFPFSALVAPASSSPSTPTLDTSSMAVLARLAGPQTPRSFLTALRDAMARHESVLESLRAAQRERTAERNLRAEQTSAYERSLAADRAKLAARREAEARAEKQAQAERERAAVEEARAENVRAWRRWRAAQIAPEPAPDVKAATRLSVRMPSGERVVRRFAPERPMEELYAFVECWNMLQGPDDEKAAEKPVSYEHEYGFRLVSPMPRAIYDLETGGTIGQRVGRSANLLVESMDTDEED